ncbi:MAG: CotH kinase family protein [Cyclobacteriaceae bacterium]
MSVPTFAQSISFNEIVSSNVTGITDEEGDQEDWIEIYNFGTTPVSLFNYGLSDDITLPFKWRFPEVVLAANEFIIIWASGKNKVILGQPLHTSFKIKSSGETITLTDPNGISVDQISSIYIPTDLSYGRFPDGAGSWSFFKELTPSAANNTQPYSEILLPVNFSRAEGFYKSSFFLEMSHPDPDAIILYTLDGSEPELVTLDSDFIHRKSYIYKEPIAIDSRIGEPNVFSTIPTTKITFPWLLPWQAPSREVYKANIVRAKAFKANAISSDTNTSTYFVDQNADSLYSTMPIISIAADYLDFFDSTTGIYVPGNNIRTIHNQNFMKGWKRSAHLEFFDINRSSGFKGTYEIRIQGSTSPPSPQKGLHVIAQSQLGSSSIDYPIFNTTVGLATKIKKFKRFIIRGWGSAIGNELYPLFADAYNQTLVEKNGLEIQAYRPCIVFINGEYWGIHELREANKNSWYYESHFNIDRNDPGFDLLAGGSPITADEGNVDHWNSFMDFVNSNDLSDNLNFETVESNIDVQNLIEYIVHCTFLGKRDWPVQNEAKWRPRTIDGRWRWTQFDMDHGLSPWGGNYDMIQGVMVESPHDLFVKLMANQRFKHNFLNTYADWMNSVFITEREIGHFNKIKHELEPYIEEHINRWPLGMAWNSNIDKALVIINNRLEQRRNDLTDFFNLTTIEATLNSDTVQGYIRINTTDIKESTPGIVANPYPWTGIYFLSIPVSLKAVAKPGYKFSHWSGASKSTISEIRLTPTANFTIQANFSIEENALLSAHPNPTNNLINIKAHNSLIGSFYSISDIHGKVSIKGKLIDLNTILDLSDFNSGMYIFKIKNRQNQSLKIIKE